MRLNGMIVEASSLLEQDIAIMYALMDKFHDDVAPDIFEWQGINTV